MPINHKRLFKFLILAFVILIFLISCVDAKEEEPLSALDNEQGLNDKTQYNESQFNISLNDATQLFYAEWEITEIYEYRHPQTFEISELEAMYLNKKITFLKNEIILEENQITLKENDDMMYYVFVLPYHDDWFLYEAGAPYYKCPTSKELGLMDSIFMPMFEIKPNYFEQLSQTNAFSLNLFYIKDRNTLIGTSDGYYFVELKRTSITPILWL